MLRNLVEGPGWMGSVAGVFDRIYRRRAALTEAGHPREQLSPWKPRHPAPDAVVGEGVGERMVPESQ